MRAETAAGRDWRDAAAYAPLLDADRSFIAWEWLRRDPTYRAAAELSRQECAPADHALGAQSFGLAAFEPPELAVPLARPIWTLEAHPYVLRACAGGEVPAGDEFVPDRLTGLVRILARGETEHLLLSDGFRAIRLDGPRGIFTGGPVGLRYLVEGVQSAEGPLMTLRRLLALCRAGQFSRSLHAREPRVRRWILLLRTADALASAADQRAIARELLSRSVDAPRWRSRESSVRSQVQRLVRGARRMASGSYVALLR